ncbi:MAG: DUF2163 domain-containing protein [Acidobacteria bacterium]|jgi:hypothetical protein|nr:DUF2163 domain-containing protein [Acidobacteriota bacterium]
MKPVDTDFAIDLASGVTTTCLCWTLTRRDGTVLAVTEHDQPLTVAGRTHEPGGSLDGVRFAATVSLAPGQAEARGALVHDGITEGDLDAGLWDEAKIDVLRVDWMTPAHHVHVWSGQLTRLRRGTAGFEAELVSLKADLERPVGRVYARRCDASLGDARCGVDLTAFPGAVCDHRFETCRDMFANTGNFRGFPHLPGTEALVSGPPATGNTGGRR